MLREDLAGIDPPAGMQGKSLMPLVRGDPAAWRSRFYYEHVYNTDPPRQPIPVTEGIRTLRWKYIRYPEVTPVYEQLFDLRADPGEANNLVDVDAHASVLARLRRMCDRASPKQQP